MITIAPTTRDDRDWITSILVETWGSTRVVSRGRLHDVVDLSGFVARFHQTRVGAVTYNIEDEECELVTLNSVQPGTGVGSALVEAARSLARQAGCRRLWLITTNDNTYALHFFQKRGFRLVALHRNAIEDSRRLKPEIPATGHRGIPIRDEIELEDIL